MICCALSTGSLNLNVGTMCDDLRSFLDGAVGAASERRPTTCKAAQRSDARLGLFLILQL
jgi:hypothetical protein